MSILVFLEHHFSDGGGELQKGSLAVLSKAAQLGAGDVAGVVVGSGVSEGCPESHPRDVEPRRQCQHVLG